MKILDKYFEFVQNLYYDKIVKGDFMKKRKFLAGICATALSIPLALGLTGCKKDNKNKFDINAKDVYAIAVASSANYLKHFESTSTDNLVTSSRPEEIEDKTVTGIRDSLELFDGFVGSSINQNTIKNTDTNFDSYTFKMTITLPGFDSMSMYYNELETKTKREIEDEKEEVEVSTTLSGVMVFGETRFAVNGKREFEQEGDETESSIEFTTRSTTNPNNYIIISQSVEKENNEYEVEYEYEIFVNGSKVQSLETEFENENNKLEFEFKLKDLSTGNLQTTVYKVKKGIEEGQYFVKYSVNGTSTQIVVTKTTDGYNFAYANGYTELVAFSK